MEEWRILVYLVAGLLAVRSLFALMTAHRNQYQQELLAEDKRIARELRKKKVKEEALAKDPIQQALAAANSKRSPHG